MNTESVMKEIITPLLNSLDSILDSAAIDKVGRHFSGFVPTCSNENLSLLLTQNIEGEMGEKLFEHIINGMSDEKFKNVLSEIKSMHDIALFQDSPGKSDAKTIERTYQNMLSSTRAGKLLKNKKETLDTLKTGLSALLKGDRSAIKDEHLMKALPDGVEQLLTKGKVSTAEAIVEKLSDSLGSENADIRSRVSEALSEIADTLIADDYLDILLRMSYKLVDWINLEPSLTPVHPKICAQLQRLAQRLIRKNRFSECRHILEVFNLISCDEIRKEEPIQILADKALRGIASEDILEHLLKEFQTDEENKRKDAVQKLILLGAPSADRLLDMLRESQSRYERTRILQLLMDIGRTAVPAIIKHINQKEPWYFIRNLVLLLGKVGGKAHLPVLQSLMHFGDLRVQREVVNSIYQIAGKDSEEIFLFVLPSADDRLKMDIIGLLGDMESQIAVPTLLDLLKSGVNSDSPMRHDLAERICAAMGVIASEHAMPMLIEIIGHSNSPKTAKSYNDRVKSAAVGALAKIRAKRSKKDGADDSDKKVISHQEKFIGRYLSKWKNDDTVEEYAVKLLLDLIVKYAREKDFSRADFYKEKLIQLDPSAEVEIRAADEIISIERKEAGDQEALPKRPRAADQKDSFLVTRW